jgi:hypothetical protein
MGNPPTQEMNKPFFELSKKLESTVEVVEVMIDPLYKDHKMYHTNLEDLFMPLINKARNLRKLVFVSSRSWNFENYQVNAGIEVFTTCATFKDLQVLE